MPKNASVLAKIKPPPAVKLGARSVVAPRAAGAAQGAAAAAGAPSQRRQMCVGVDNVHENVSRRARDALACRLNDCNDSNVGHDAALALI